MNIFTALRTRRVTSFVAPVIAAFALAGMTAGGAAASGTITVGAGGTRTATETDAGYAAALAGVPFESAPWVSDPTTAVWSAMCTTAVAGTCTSGSLANGRYLVREASNGLPLGWPTFQSLSWGGGSGGGSLQRSYVGDVTISNNAPTVHPSTAWNPTAPSATSGAFVVAKANPTLPERCDLDVLLLLDRSGSITANAASYKAAAHDFVNTLAGTPVRVKIFSFSATATANQNTFLNLSVPADVAIANTVIDTVYGATGGTTNWDAGMKLASTAGVDLVTFVTDGNPTVHLTNGSAGTGSTVNLLDLTAGMASANLVKTQGKSTLTPLGATIRAIGVGSGVTVGNLSAMSGPVSGTDYSAAGVSELKAELQKLANRLCGARIHVRKLTDEGDPSVAKTGWTVGVASTDAGATFTPASLVTSGGAADDVLLANKVAAGGIDVSVTETQQAGFNFVASACQTGGFPAPVVGGGVKVTIPKVSRNEDWYCTFRNARKSGTLTVVKRVQSVDPHDAGLFNLQIDGATAGTGANVGNNGTTGARTLLIGNHAFGETAAAGTSLADYTAAALCKDATGATVAQSPAGTVNVTDGAAITCTITNTRNLAKLTVIKKVVNDNGGTAVPGDFTMTVDDPGTNPPSFRGADTPGTDVLVDPGAYTTTEGTHTGYAVSYSADCNASLAAGQSKVCTVTNNDVAPTIKVVKLVVNDDGGTAVPGDFSMHLKSGGTDVSGSPKAGKAAGDTYTVGAGVFTVSETGGPSGYTATFSGDCNLSGVLSVSVGQDRVCTVTNNDVAPTVKVVKLVVNDDGGTAVPGDFSMHLKSGGTDVSGSPKAGKVAGDTYTVGAGAFTVSETGGPSGYAATYSGDCNLSGALSVSVGQDRVCTVTNDDVAPTVKVVKLVTNDSGGAAVSADWMLHLKTSGAGAADVAGSPKSGKVAGDTYTVGAGAFDVSETGGPSGYAATFSGDCDAAGHLTVAVGQGKICTITNDDVPASLKVIKHVVNDDGGSAVAGDFTLTVDDPGSSPAPFAGSETGTTVAIDPAGAYTTTEGAHPGYAVSYSAGCNGTAAVGEGKLCTVTNDDIAPKLTVIKHVVNKNGSTATASDFSMHVDGTAGTRTFDGTESPGVTKTLQAGSFDVSETGTATADYAASESGSCHGDLAVGDVVTCTITNTRKTGTIEVVKDLVPASDGGRFDLKIDGSTLATDIGDKGTTGAISVNTGSHTFAEAAGTGTSLGDYTAGSVCRDANRENGVVTQDPQGTIDVASGADITCTITNVRKATVVIHNVTDPHSAGVDFGFASGLPAGAGVAQDGSFALADGGSTTSTVEPGTYAVSENDPRPLGYKLVGLVCTESKDQNSTVSTGAAVATSRSASIQADPGEVIDCVFTNRKIVGQAVVVKVGDTFAYHGDTVSYTFSVTNTGNSPLHDVKVTDDKCPNVSAAPVSKSNDNGDAVLDPVGANGTSPEVWVFTCSYQLGTHAAGEASPVINTATVTGTDEYDRPVTDTDQHATRILHQGLALAKTGPASAASGDRVVYALWVSNTGDTSFAATSLNVTDALCDAPPLRASTGSDTTPSSLDPGDAWIYTCSVTSVAGQTSIHNVADVVGKDVHNRSAQAQATADTLLTNVLPVTVRSGAAKLRGTTGCIPSAARVTVTGSKVKSVTFTVDGKKRKKLLKPNLTGKRYMLTVPATSIGYGTHRVQATVVFTAASKTKTKRLTMIITRCRPPKPHFTG